MTLGDGIISFILSVIGSLLASDLDKYCREKYKCGIFRIIYLKALVTWASFVERVKGIASLLTAAARYIKGRTHVGTLTSRRPALFQLRVGILILAIWWSFVLARLSRLSGSVRAGITSFSYSLPAPGLNSDVSRRRALVVASFLLLWMSVVGARLAYIQTSQHEWLSERARKQQVDVGSGHGASELILDREGRELARSVNVDSFFADPREIEHVGETAARLANVLDLDAASLASRLDETKKAGRAFVWLARKVDAERAEAVQALKIKGVHSVEEQKRRYPNGELAAHVLNSIGDYGEGPSGSIQKQFPGYDRTLILTIDQTVQYIVERELAAAVNRTRAKSATVVVVKPQAGEILALANAPTFDPNEAGSRSAEAQRNNALQNIYEPGATFNLVPYTAALEERLITPDTRIECEGAIGLPERVVQDHGSGSLTATEALARSSNVAAIKLGMKLGNERLYDYIRRLGFGSKTGIELPGETAGLVRPVSNWQPGSIGSVPIGHEIGVTPVQLAAAYATIANDGVWVPPHIVREVRDSKGRIFNRPLPETHRVVSEQTARELRGMLESVALNGTAKAAQLEGYTAAGKTGTAEKIDSTTNAYSQTKYVASFAGFAPADKPAVVIIVVVDEPEGRYLGGQVAAPVFSEIADQILPYLDVEPDVQPRREVGHRLPLSSSGDVQARSRMELFNQDERLDAELPLQLRGSEWAAECAADTVAKTWAASKLDSNESPSKNERGRAPPYRSNNAGNDVCAPKITYT